MPMLRAKLMCLIMGVPVFSQLRNVHSFTKCSNELRDSRIKNLKGKRNENKKLKGEGK
jgi:hypothetical protein